jgi:hypothetical protein
MEKNSKKNLIQKQIKNLLIISLTAHKKKWQIMKLKMSKVNF